MSKKSSTRSKIISVVIFVAVMGLLAALMLLDIYRCPFKAVTGIPCPGCGMTRAVLSALRGDFRTAFYYHPLWIVAVPLVLVEFLNAVGGIKIPAKVNNVILIIAGILLLAVYVIRMCTGTLVY